MIIYHRTNVLESAAQTVVNTVNCVGVMGKGLAAAYKKRHPDMFKAYKNICDQNLLETGKLWLWKSPDQWVLNFPTKQHWRAPSKLEWVEAGLQKFVNNYERLGITEIAFPKLGCGNGNLDWDQVRPVMEKYLGPLPVTVFIHDFEKSLGLPEHLDAAIQESIGAPMPTSISDFWQALDNISNRFGNELIDFENQTPFQISRSENAILFNSSIFEKEELYEFWQTLMKGMLTKKNLGLSNLSNASKLISTFSLMPSVRPIEIQHAKSSEPEIAAQAGGLHATEALENASTQQLSLSWQ